eukprot:Gb_10236 [translate_table: standard]
MGEVEFWLLFLLYVRHVVSKQKSLNSNLNAIEQQIVPLLDRFNFLSECKDLRPLTGIVDTLRAEGFVLPFTTRKLLCSQLLRRALAANSVSEAKNLVDYAKSIVNFSFYALREAKLKAKIGVSSNNNMLYVVEERICSSIFDQDRLLQGLDFDVQYRPRWVLGFGFQKMIFSNLGILGLYLGNGLQSQNSEKRLLAIKLACTCSFNSHTIFSRLLPIFETALYHEDFATREYVMAALMDLIFVHQRSINLQTVFHFIYPFLYAPKPTLQLTAVIGCGRLLLLNCFPDETECLLSVMLQRYVYNFPDYCSIKGKLQQVAHALQIFFREYCGDKQLHQDEIANTLVYLCLQKIDEGVVQVDTARKYIEDNPMKAKEARALHLAINFGLSLCSDVLDAVVDSLILNIDEEMGIPVLNKTDCLQWFLSK